MRQQDRPALPTEIVDGDRHLVVDDDGRHRENLPEPPAGAPL